MGFHTESGWVLTSNFRGRICWQLLPCTSPHNQRMYIFRKIFFYPGIEPRDPCIRKGPATGQAPLTPPASPRPNPTSQSHTPAALCIISPTPECWNTVHIIPPIPSYTVITLHIRHEPIPSFVFILHVYPVEFHMIPCALM